MDIETKQIFAQIIDNQMELNKKVDNLIKVVNDLANTIIKYDNEYQNQIAQGAIEE
jgi:hypothetical protein